MQVLHNHVSPDTSLMIESYPYGFRLRCKIRYWLETATKGSAKGQVRLMSQTTNPRLPGEVWNKPKGSVYADVAVLLQDPSNGHVCWDSISRYSNPNRFREFRAAYYDQMSDQDKAKFDILEQWSRKSSPNSWAEMEALETNSTSVV